MNSDSTGSITQQVQSPPTPNDTSNKHLNSFAYNKTKQKNVYWFLLYKTTPTCDHHPLHPEQSSSIHLFHIQMWTLWCTIEMQPMWTRALSSPTWGWRSAPHPGCISLSSTPLQCTLEMTDRWSLMDDIIEKQQRWHPNATTLDTLQNLHCALMLGAWILHTGGADKKPCQSLMPN